MPASDHDLLREYAEQGSQAAFTELVGRHLDLVYSAARRQVNSSALAEEIGQSVFLDLSRNARCINPRKPLVAWLFFVTRRTAIDVVRRESRREAREQTAIQLDSMNPNASIWTEVAPFLDSALEKLSETDRTAVLLRFFQNKNSREVGQILGSSEDAAQKRIVRAIDRLRTILSRDGVAVGAAGLVTSLSAHAIEIAPASFAGSIAVPACAPSAPGVSATLLQAAISKTAIGSLAAALLLFSWGWRIHVAHALPASPEAAVQMALADGNPPAAVAVSSTEPASAGVQPSPESTAPAAAALYRLDNPEYRRNAMARAKTNLNLFYGPLFAQLNLPSAQLDQLMDLLVEKQMANTDAGRVARINGIQRGEDDEGYYAAVAMGQRDVDAKLKTLLGDVGYENYVAYERSFPVRMTLAYFRNQLSDTEPLSDEQAGKLLHLFIATRKFDNVRDTVGMGIEIGAGGSPAPLGGIPMEAVRGAKNLLSSIQWQALKDLRAQLQLDRANKALDKTPKPINDPLLQAKNPPAPP